MLPIKHVLPVVFLALVTHCGGAPYSPYPNPYTPPPSSPPPNPDPGFVAGASCTGRDDCGDGWCGTWGTCSKDCATQSQCGSGGVCIRFSDGTQCHRRCSAASDCQSGFVCRSTTEGGGYCRPADVETKDPIGAACISNAECATNVCAAQEGGYCTKACSSQNDCDASSACINNAFDGVRACLARCSAPDSQSSCRPGYSASWRRPRGGLPPTFCASTRAN